MQYNMRKKLIREAKRVVLKFGTNVLRQTGGNIAIDRIESFVAQICELKKRGIEVILVTSGAVGLGAKKLGVDPKESIVVKQACASIGQTKLMCMYDNLFSERGIVTSQVLLTEEDFSQRVRYLNLSNVLNKLLEFGVVPIINQNDTVSTDELESLKDYIEVSFSDNDKLSALVASRLGADLLVIFSDVDGLFDDNPKKNPKAKIIPVVEEVDDSIERFGQEASNGGTGGMKTKLKAAKVVTRSGGSVIIVNGKERDIVKKVFDENVEFIGTLFLPKEALCGKKRWIGYAVNIKGQIIINAGAKKAIMEENSSLLPIGVEQIINDFQKGDVVSILDESRKEIAHGVINYNCSDCKKIIGKHSDKIVQILGYKNYDAIITRDNIVIL